MPGRQQTPGEPAGSEQWLRTLVEGMTQLVWRAVGAGDWTWSSPQWLQYTGQTSEQSSGQGWLEAVHPEDQETACAAWRVAQSSRYFQVDLRIRALEKGYRWFRTEAKPAINDVRQVVEWLGTSTDIDDLRQLEAEQKVLVAELQHRTRNLIAVVHSIFLQTFSRTATLDDFRDRFEERLAALSRVQALLSTSEQTPITIRHLVELELDALADGLAGERVQLTGRNIVIRTGSAQTLALAVHELLTNAVKHGALSQPAGRLDISWSEQARDGVHWMHLQWSETGLDTTTALQDAKPGYGRLLIEQALPRQLDASTRMTFGDGRVDCTIELPLRARRSASADD
jgi:two-component system CheB/CheR fusion protein